MVAIACCCGMEPGDGRISGSNSGQCEVVAAAAAPWRPWGKLKKGSCVGWGSCDGLSGLRVIVG